MSDKLNLGGGVIGLLFLGVGVVQFLQGDSWVVWAILGFLFGGFGAAGKLLKSSKE